MRILVLNIGSSTLKAMLCSTDDNTTQWEARADWGHEPGRAVIRYLHDGKKQETSQQISAPEEIFESIVRAAPSPIDAAGHRIVDGGEHFREPARVSAEVKRAILEFAKSAPNHNRLELAGIEAVERVFGPQFPQIAVFDTAFHTTLAPAAFTYPGPYGWLGKGIRRYGFHGINHEYIARRTAELLRRDPQNLKLVSCHLGNGCSLAAIANGKSVDTTMGFTPLEGLMMGTRSGSVDPAILIHLAREEGCSPDDLDRILNKESGLKGLSGISGDLREIHAAIGKGNDRARLAFDVFVHRLVREIGGMAAVLNGIDALAFTGGIGENDAQVRRDTCARLSFLGLRLDPPKNEAASEDADLSAPGAAVRVLMIHAQEEWEIARDCARLLTKASAPGQP